jgi:subtilisin family serine protease
MSLGCSSVFDAVCKSVAEEQFFDKAFNEGHLSVAAAGNAGNTQNSWPASYNSVISVAAVDSTKTQASFSQRNSYVEIAAPGVNVYSTYPMGMGEATTFTVNGVSYSAESLDGSPYAKGIGRLVNCGLGTSLCPSATGAVCLIQRGEIAFSDKVLNCQNAGGIGAVIYNNVPGNFLGTLNGVPTLIPSASLAQADGQTLVNLLNDNAPADADLEIQVDNYAFLDGTSMATPHVSGVLAKVWSNNKGWTNQQLRTTMQNTATPCTGQTGKNVQCGWGIIQGGLLYNQLRTKYGGPEANITLGQH